MSEAPPPPPETAPVPPQTPKQGNGLAIAGMVLGIVGLALFCIPYIGVPCAVVGLILSILGKKRAALTGTGGGMATAGLILSILAIAVDVILLIAVGGAVMEAFRKAQEQQSQQSNGPGVMMLLSPWL